MLIWITLGLIVLFSAALIAQLVSRRSARAQVAAGPVEPLADVDDLDDFDDETGATKPLPSVGAVPFNETGFEDDEKTNVIDVFAVETGAASDVGRKREHNEDSFICLHEHYVYAVADGIGGEAAGEVASALAVEGLQSYFESQSHNVPDWDDVPRYGRELVQAVGEANLAVRKAAREDRAKKGMGTTIVCLRFVPKKKRVFMAHVGDSRAYRVRDGRFVQLTEDHTMERIVGAKGVMADKLAWALGGEDRVQTEVQDSVLKHGDTYVLCSDGLSKMVGDSRMLEILLEEQDRPKICAQKLVDEANAEGGRDNITVIVARVIAPSME